MGEGIEMKVLLVGDIVGSPGRGVFREVVARLRAAGEIHAVVANGENSAGGNGITGPIAQELFDAGADVITLGDHTWNQKGLDEFIAREKRLLRPANFSKSCPGHGIVTVQTPLGPLTVINLIGRVFLANPYECPFECADSLLKALPAGSPVVVDFHAEATSEKISMGRFLAGRVAAVVGTHTHVQTSDERVLPGGTAYLTDLGMTGPVDSVLGRDIESVIRKFRTGMPVKMDVAEGRAALEGAIVDIDRETRKAKSIRRIREFV